MPTPAATIWRGLRAGRAEPDFRRSGQRHTSATAAGDGRPPAAAFFAQGQADGRCSAADVRVHGKQGPNGGVASWSSHRQGEMAASGVFRGWRRRTWSFPHQQRPAAGTTRAPAGRRATGRAREGRCRGGPFRHPIRERCAIWCSSSTSADAPRAQHCARPASASPGGRTTGATPSSSSTCGSGGERGWLTKLAPGAARNGGVRPGQRVRRSRVHAGAVGCQQLPRAAHSACGISAHAGSAAPRGGFAPYGPSVSMRTVPPLLGAAKPSPCPFDGWLARRLRKRRGRPGEAARSTRDAAFGQALRRARQAQPAPVHIADRRCSEAALGRVAAALGRADQPMARKDVVGTVGCRGGPEARRAPRARRRRPRRSPAGLQGRREHAGHGDTVAVWPDLSMRPCCPGSGTLEPCCAPHFRFQIRQISRRTRSSPSTTPFSTRRQRWKLRRDPGDPVRQATSSRLERALEGKTAGDRVDVTGSVQTPRRA